MNDDTHSCFGGPFTHRICCTSPTPVLSGCSCTSFYLQEAAAFLLSIRGNYISPAEVNGWDWKYHPTNCDSGSLRAALARASKRTDDECVNLEKLHYLVSCGLRTGWWLQDNLAIDEFWNEIMTLSIKLLSSTCHGLLSPQEVFHNYRRFQGTYLSNSEFWKSRSFEWQRSGSLETPTSDPRCNGVTFRRPTVHCAVMGRLPEEIALARSIMQTWGRDCDSIQMYVAQVPMGATTWQDRRSGIQVMNLARRYPVLQRHPDQVGHFSGDLQFMLPGHFDDVVTGLCFQIMDLLPHHALQSSSGQYLFNGDMVPQHTTGTLNGSFANWSFFRRLHHLFQCETHCEDCSCSSINPEFWVDEKTAITFHRYKNATGMRLAYHQLRAL